MTGLDPKLETAILAYRLKRAWQEIDKGVLTDGQCEKVVAAATSEEARILSAPMSVVDFMSFMADIDFYPSVEQVVAMLGEATEEDWQAVTNECAKLMDLFARTVPETFTGFKSQVSDEDRGGLHLLRDVAPNLVAVLEVPTV